MHELAPAGVSQVRGPYTHWASMCCMFAFLQHETSQAREGVEGAGASGAGRGFEGRRLTRRSCAASPPSCNTRHHTHAGRQPLEPAPACEAQV